MRHKCTGTQLAIVLLGTISYVHGQCEYAAGGWNYKETKCNKGFTEVFKEDSAGATLRYCCDENHKDFLPHMLNKGTECRSTSCGSASSSYLCGTLDDRFVNGQLLEDYEEVMREPCTTSSGSVGAVALCCMRNSTEGLLATTMGAEPHEFPHQAKLRLPGHCGGTVYNKRWIVTAAHCIVDGETHELSDASAMEVVLGTNIGDMKGEEYVYKVEELIPHPDYSKLSPNPEIEKGEQARTFNDIALIKLSRDIKFGPKVKALQIAPKGFTPLEYNNKAVIVGWGTTDTLDISLHLQKANFIIRKDGTCFGLRKKENKWGPHAEMEGMEDQLLCVGGIIEGKWSPTAGGGDSGGPAICRGQDGKVVLCGVTSFGGSDEKCAEHNNEEYCLPSVYAEVAHFHDWIEEHAGKQDPKTLYKPYLYGEPVPKNKYTHQVHITSDGKPCGGTLIAPDVVITAAQCVMTPDKKSRKGLKVTSGLNDLKGKGTTHGITKIAALSGFMRTGAAVDPSKQGNRVLITDNYYKNDLAMLKLDGKASVPANMLPGLPDESPAMGMELAWPRNNTKGTQLMAREYKFLDKADCQTRMNRMRRAGMEIQVDKSLLCGVEKYSGGSTCDRELGGGVICKGKGGKDVLCGVQVFRLCEWSIPNGFMNMALYKKWVNDFLQKSS